MRYLHHFKPSLRKIKLLIVSLHVGPWRREVETCTVLCGGALCWIETAFDISRQQIQVHLSLTECFNAKKSV